MGLFKLRGIQSAREGIKVSLSQWSSLLRSEQPWQQACQGAVKGAIEQENQELQVWKVCLKVLGCHCVHIERHLKIHLFWKNEKREIQDSNSRSKSVPVRTLTKHKDSHIHGTLYSRFCFSMFRTKYNRYLCLRKMEHEKNVQVFDLVKNNLYLNVQGQTGMAAHCYLSHRVIEKNIIKTGSSQVIQRLVSDSGACFKWCYVLIDNRESKAQMRFQRSTDPLSKIMENFQ